MHLPAIIDLTGFGLIFGGLCLYVALACSGGDPQMDGPSSSVRNGEG